MRAPLLLLLILASCARPPQPPPLAPAPELAPLRHALAYEGDNRDEDKLLATLLLTLYAGPDALPALARAVRLERNEAVRAAAARGLGRVGLARGAAPLEEGLEGDLYQVAPSFEAAAVEALGRIGGQAARLRLTDLLERAPAHERANLLAAVADGEGAWRAALIEAPPAPSATGAAAPSRRIHVDASDGDDGGDGSASAPYRTLRRALQDLVTGRGDHVLATAGARDEPFREEVALRPVHGGVPGRPTVIGPWPGRRPPHLDGHRGDGAPPLESGFSVGASWTRVEGFTVRGFSQNGIAAMHSHHVVIADCSAVACGRHGFFAYHAPHTTFVRPRARRSEAQGISIRSSPHSAVLGGSSEDNGIDGLLLLRGSDDVVVHGLRATANRRGVALIYGSDRAQLSGLQLIGNERMDLDLCNNCSAFVVDSQIGLDSRRERPGGEGPAPPP